MGVKTFKLAFIFFPALIALIFVLILNIPFSYSFSPVCPNGQVPKCRLVQYRYKSFQQYAPCVLTGNLNAEYGSFVQGGTFNPTPPFSSQQCDLDVQCKQKSMNAPCANSTSCDVYERYEWRCESGSWPLSPNRCTPSDTKSCLIAHSPDGYELRSFSINAQKVRFPLQNDIRDRGDPEVPQEIGIISCFDSDGRIKKECSRSQVLSSGPSGAFIPVYTLNLTNHTTSGETAPCGAGNCRSLPSPNCNRDGSLFCTFNPADPDKADVPGPDSAFEENSDVCQWSVNGVLDNAGFPQTPLVYLDTNKETDNNYNQRCCGDDFFADESRNNPSNSYSYVCIKGRGGAGDETSGQCNEHLCWQSAIGNNVGTIYFSSNGYFDILGHQEFTTSGPGKSYWVACDGRNAATTAAQIGSFSIKSNRENYRSAGNILNEHNNDYLCYFNAMQTSSKWSKCIDAAQPGNNDPPNGQNTGGDTFTPGSIIPIKRADNSLALYYCRKGSRWSTDLDNNLIEFSGSPAKESCEAAGYTWTGARCCGEEFNGNVNEKIESYNDATYETEQNNVFGSAVQGTPTGCFWGNAIPNNTRLDRASWVRNSNFESDTLNKPPLRWKVSSQTGAVVGLPPNIPLLAGKVLVINPGHIAESEPFSVPNWKYFGLAADVRCATGGLLQFELLTYDTWQKVLDISTPQTPQIMAGFIFQMPANKASEHFEPAPYLKQSQYAGAQAASLRITSPTGQCLVDNVMVWPQQEEAAGLTGQQVIYVNKSFHSCKAQGVQSGANVPRHDDTTTPAPDDLILNHDWCDVTGNFYCSPNGNIWNDTPLVYDKVTYRWRTFEKITVNANTRNTLKQRPGNVTAGIDKNCCPSLWCWNGTSCLPEQSDALIEPQNGLKCINGQWKTVQQQTTPRGEDYGFCPDRNDCLLDIYGKTTNNYNQLAYSEPAKLASFSAPRAPLSSGSSSSSSSSSSTSIPENDNAQCIANGQFAQDYLCESGSWASRTKKLASEMIRLEGRQQNFVLYCDTPAGISNFLNYTALTGNSEQNIKAFLEGISVASGIATQAFSPCKDSGNNNIPCVNRICLSNWLNGSSEAPKDLVLGASLNQPIFGTLDASGVVPAGKFLFSEALEILPGTQSIYNYCPAVRTGGDIFQSCGPNMLYNNQSWLVMFVKNPTSVNIFSSQTTFLNSLLTPIRAALTFIINVIRPTSLSGATLQLPFLQQTSLFDKLYYLDSGQKAVVAVMESRFNKLDDRITNPNAVIPNIETYIALRYFGFKSSDICNSLKAYSTQKSGSVSDFYCSCSVEAGKAVTTVFVKSPSNRGLSSWQDLTSRIRLESGALVTTCS